MFKWKKKLLNSLNIRKQEKELDKNKTVDVGLLISKRLLNTNNDGSSYIGGKLDIDDSAFTEDDRKNYGKKRAEQIKNKEPVEVQLPSTAIESARFDEDNMFSRVTVTTGYSL